MQTRILRAHHLYQSYFVLILFFPLIAFGQSGLEGRITETINDLVRIINVLIIGFVVWSGFVIARGDGSGLTRLIYSIIGLLVVNGAYLIINYFR